MNLRVNNAAFDTMAKAVARVREMSYALQAEGYSVAALNPAGLLIPKAPAPAVSVPPRVAAPVFPVGLEDLWAMLQAQQQSAPTQDTLKSLVAAIQQMSRSNNAPPPPAPVAEHKETQNAQQYQNQDQYQNRGPRRRPPPTATCHNCGIAGHMSRGCLLPRRPRGTHQQNQQQTQTPNAAPPAPPSRSAQQEGHSVNKLVGAIQASPSAPQRHVLTVPVQLFDKSFNVLLDTCSPVSIVSPAVAAQIAKWCPVEKADEIEDLLGAGGEQLGFKGKVIVPFQFINAKPEHLLPAKLTFFVVDRFPGDLLIGLSDLGSLGFEVSTVHWTAYFATLGVTLDVKQAKSAGFTVTVVPASNLPKKKPLATIVREMELRLAANMKKDVPVLPTVLPPDKPLLPDPSAITVTGAAPPNPTVVASNDPPAVADKSTAVAAPAVLSADPTVSVNPSASDQTPPVVADTKEKNTVDTSAHAPTAPTPTPDGDDDKTPDLRPDSDDDSDSESAGGSDLDELLFNLHERNILEHVPRPLKTQRKMLSAKKKKKAYRLKLKLRKKGLVSVVGVVTNKADTPATMEPTVNEGPVFPFRATIADALLACENPPVSSPPPDVKESKPLVLVDAGTNESIQAPPSSNLAPDKQIRLDTLLKKYNDVFATDKFNPGLNTNTKHLIDTPNTSPIFTPQFPQSLADQEEIDRQVTLLEKHNLVTKTWSQWNSPTLLVKEKEGDKRLCVSYKKLNERSGKARSTFADA